MISDDFKQLDRSGVTSALQQMLPYLQQDSTISPTQGGRAAGLKTLALIQPVAYERSRNYLAGSITRLSAYLRHGVLTLAEVRDYALREVRDPAQAGKLINEFGWRDYWQRLYAEIGEGVWQNREPYKTGHSASAYAKQLPAEIASAETTLVCMDSFSRDLQRTGYLHNHARLWFAAYIVHWRRTSWQAGARWFLEHLIDGDPASNNLSWQWVASTFATAPYIFNRENLQRYSEDVYCKVCPHAKAGTCPFDDSYEALEQTLFPRLQDRAQDAGPVQAAPYTQKAEAAAKGTGRGVPLLWHHTDSLNPASTLVTSHPGASGVFIWDTGWLLPARISMKRVQFIAESLLEIPGRVEMRVGEPAKELLGAAESAGADYILAQRTADPRLQAAAVQVQRRLPVVWFDPPPFVEASRGFDLKRFSRYWKRAQASAMQPTRS